MKLMKLQRRVNEIIYKKYFVVPIGTLELTSFSQEKGIREKEKSPERRQVEVGQEKT